MRLLMAPRISQEAWYHFLRSPLTFLVNAPDTLSTASMVPFYAASLIVITIATSVRYLIMVPVFPLAVELVAKTWLFMPIAGVAIIPFFSLVVLAMARTIHANLVPSVMVRRLSVIWMAASPILMAGSLISEFFFDPIWPIALTLSTAIIATTPGIARALHVPWPKAVFMIVPLLLLAAITAWVFTTWPIGYAYVTPYSYHSPMSY